jgi:serine/threonine protein phosphatase PrpC
LIVCLIIENKAYIANVGDSRAFLSSKNGNQITELSIDHKPHLKIERERI